MILPTIFTILLILDYLKNITKKTSIEIVNEMGIGYNLGHSFDSCYLFSNKINNPDDAITLFGNPIPTKNLITNIKKYGFKTIRFPVTWIYFIDEFGNIDPEWILRVKEVVKWIIDKNVYCILNVYTDTEEWINGIKSKDKYINLWKQIAEEFKDFNEYLIFESMNEPLFLTPYLDYDYDTLLNFSQSFIDTIRNSEKYNKERLLIISGMSSNLELTCTEKYKMPTDPANKMAISINYYIPSRFTGKPNYWYAYNTWGDQDEYRELFRNFESLTNFFISNGIPVVIGEVGVKTETTKELASIREYLYSVFSLSTEYEGIMACLWDTSNKDYGDMNYYNRLINEWYDDKIKNIFMKISKGNIVKSSDFYIYSNLEAITTNFELFYGYSIDIGAKKPLKIILNLNYKGKFNTDYYFEVYCFDIKNWISIIRFDERNSKKHYDGTITYSIDISNKDCKDYLEIYYYYGEIYFNNITIEYQENYKSFDYNNYKAKIISEIN